MTALVWFRRDLRIADNPALAAAAASGQPVVAVYILSTNNKASIGSASRVWLHASLSDLRESLLNLGVDLIFQCGPPSEILRDLCAHLRVSALHWNREYDPAAIEDAVAVKRDLGHEVSCHSYPSRLLAEPFNFKNKSGNPYRVFTPFWKTLFDSAQAVSVETIAPDWRQDRLTVVDSRLEDLALLSGHPWEEKIRKYWQIGEVGAWRQFDTFLEGAITNYDEKRDLPAVAGTSKLSPYLHFGEISVRRIWQRLLLGMEGFEFSGNESAVQGWLRQLGWREFSHHLLFHFPESATQALNPKFANMAWLNNNELVSLWQRGQTGYPLVDAGMRELWTTGWMHNRVRMVVASFLTKHIGADWREGAEWFWDTLIDADMANNTMGWQWVAGCGADAAPYYRIFNPTRQSEKFDGTAEYIRRWVPELAALGNKEIHAPSQANLVEKNISYPLPCVDHKQAREAALVRYQSIKS